MPGYRGHLLGGLGAFSVTLAALYATRSIQLAPIEVGQWLGFSLAGSLFPDVDIKSKGQKVFYWFVLFGFIYLILMKKLALLALLSLFAMLPMLVKHRGIFHRIWFVVGVPALAAWSCISYLPFCNHAVITNTLFFVAGAVSHLWLDLGFRRMIRI